jgi:hypothetical protein
MKILNDGVNITNNTYDPKSGMALITAQYTRDIAE